jgi:hypothetical protein
MAGLLLAISLMSFAALVWVMFLSWLVARFAFRDQPPAARAARTSATSWLIASLLGMFSGISATRLGPFPPDQGALTLVLPFLIYAVPALIDFLLLRRHFAKGWVEDQDMALTFD